MKSLPPLGSNWGTTRWPMLTGSSLTWCVNWTGPFKNNTWHMIVMICQSLSRRMETRSPSREVLSSDPVSVSSMLQQHHQEFLLFLKEQLLLIVVTQTKHWPWHGHTVWILASWTLAWYQVFQLPPSISPVGEAAHQQSFVGLMENGFVSSALLSWKHLRVGMSCRL